MQFAFSVPTKIFFDKEVLKNHKEEFKRYGTSALVMTGRHSAKATGALDDLSEILEEEGITFTVFDRVENNPSLETVEEAAALARGLGAEMVISIGGGSPIDAGKAVAVLAANPALKGMELFENKFTRALPVLAIPTTAGTGSEVTPYSVLSVQEKGTKLSFGTRDTLPACAFLDEKYTAGLGMKSTFFTAVDAFTHNMEGYLANRGTCMTAPLAKEGMRVFGQCLPILLEKANACGDAPESFSLPPEIREKLMYASMLGGMVIAHCGVTAVHGMGYCYTVYHHTPHGQANGYLVRAYLHYLEDACSDKIAQVLKLTASESIDALCGKIDTLIGLPPKLTTEDIPEYTRLSLIQKGSLANTPVPTGEKEVAMLWTQMSEEKN